VYGSSGGSCTTGSATYARMRLSDVHTSDSDSTYSYDPRGRINHYTQTTGGQPYAFSLQYTLFGSLKAATYPSGRQVLQDYDDRLVSAVRYSTPGSSGSYATSIEYAPQGAVSQIAFHNGVTEIWQFNSARQQPTCISAAKSGSALLSLTLAYEARTKRVTVYSFTDSRPLP
jgi:hypothetical protein